MKREFLIPFVLCSLTFVLLIRTLDEPGLTWDEANFIPSSISYLNWFQVLGDDIRQGNLSHALSPDVITNYWRGTSEHPPFSKLLSALTIFLFHGPFNLIFAARISTAFIFLMLILLVYKFTCEMSTHSITSLRAPAKQSRDCHVAIAPRNDMRFTEHLIDETVGREAACFSALALLIMPRVFGHAHLAALDTCMAFMWFLTVFSFVRGIHSRRWSICTGIVYGLALAAKLNAVFLPIPLIIWGYLYHRKEYSRNMIAMFFISPVIFFLIWPWLWHEPFTRTAHYLALQVHRISIPLYYFGTVYGNSRTPWHYPIIMTLVTLPPVVLILAMISAFRIVKHRFMDSGGTLILLNIAACIGIFILPQAKKYDGVRLFLPAFPFIACLAGIALSSFLKKISLLEKQSKLCNYSICMMDQFHQDSVFEGSSPKGLETFPTTRCGRHFLMPIRVGVTLVAAQIYKITSYMFKKPYSILVAGILLLAVSALPLINIRPYYLSYYNIFAGGVKGAEHRGFETTYWGDSCTEDILNYLNKNACQNARVAFYPVGCNVVTLYQLTGRLRSDIVRIPLEEWETLDYLVLNCRQGFFDEKLWKVYREREPEYATTFQGVLLTAIYKISSLRSESAQRTTDV